MFYFIKTPWLLKKMYPACEWEIKGAGKKIYTSPLMTGRIPRQLYSYCTSLRSTRPGQHFFCVGKNVKDYFEIYTQMISDSHKPGNHTFNHLNGWKTPDKKYLEDILQAANIIDSDLFRPPYGKITKFQLKALRGEKFKLRTIMWNVLSGDFDEKITPENCYLNVINNTAAGSIIVFHDSLKALPRLQYALPRVLEYFTEKGFQFKTITP